MKLELLDCIPKQELRNEVKVPRRQALELDEVIQSEAKDLQKANQANYRTWQTHRSALSDTI